MNEITAIDRRIIFIDDILTLQTEVRKKRLEDFKQFISKGYEEKIEPIQVMEFKDNSSKYLLRDGNHRLRVRWELGEKIISAIVLDNSIDPMIKGEIGHHISEIKISNEIKDEDIKKEKWKSDKHFFNYNF